MENILSNNNYHELDAICNMFKDREIFYFLRYDICSEDLNKLSNIVNNTNDDIYIPKQMIDCINTVVLMRKLNLDITFSEIYYNYQYAEPEYKQKLIIKFFDNLFGSDLENFMKILSIDIEDELSAISYMLSEYDVKQYLSNVLKEQPELFDDLLDIICSTQYNNTYYKKKIINNIYIFYLIEEHNIDKPFYEIYHNYLNVKNEIDKLDQIKIFCQHLLGLEDNSEYLNDILSYNVNEELFAIKQMLSEDTVKQYLLSLLKGKHELSNNFHNLLSIINDRKYDNVHCIKYIRKIITNINVMKALNLNISFIQTCDNYYDSNKENKDQYIEQFCKYLFFEDDDFLDRILTCNIVGIEYVLDGIDSMISENDVKQYMIQLLIDNNNLYQKVSQIINKYTNNAYNLNDLQKNMIRNLKDCVTKAHDKINEKYK